MTHLYAVQHPVLVEKHSCSMPITSGDSRQISCGHRICADDIASMCVDSGLAMMRHVIVQILILLCRGPKLRGLFKHKVDCVRDDKTKLPVLYTVQVSPAWTQVHLVQGPLCQEPL